MKPAPHQRGAGLWPTWVAVAGLVLPGLTAAAQQTNAPARRDYASFRIITERNIFNASRSGRSSRGQRPPSRPRQVDSFTLVGTLQYEKGPFAFFDGSSGSYRKVLTTEQTIAGYKVLRVTPHGVTLEMDKQQVELKVGMQMRREDEGAWQLVEGGSESARPTPTVAAAGPATSSDNSDADSEVLQRLLRQREQELK